MTRARWLAAMLWPVFLLGAGAPAGSAELSAQDVVAAVEQASRTEGFRLRATLARHGEEKAEPLRVLLAGQRDETRQRLLIRALAPVTWHDQAIVVEAAAGAATRAMHYRAGDEAPATVADVYAPVFDGGLVPWDLLGEWWRWPRQSRVRDETVLGHDCVVVDSRGGRGPVARVRSWIAPALRLPLRVEFYRPDASLLRAIRVERVTRLADGRATARVMTLMDANGSVVRFDVYSGENGVVLDPMTFALPGAGRRERR